MYQEVIKVSVYRCSDEAEDFKTAFDKTYIGQIYVMWKECVHRETDGESPWINFSEELRDPEGNCTVDLSGMLQGSVKWVKFGSKDSKFNSKGERLEEPKA